MAKLFSLMLCFVLPVLWLAWAGSGAALAGPTHIGLNFIAAPMTADPRYLYDFLPFGLTQPENYFVRQGAFAGLSEDAARRLVAMAVEDAFTALYPPDSPGTTGVSFSLGPVPTNVGGRRLNVMIGQSAASYWSLLGQSFQSSYASASNDTVVAAIYADDVDRLGATYVQFSTAESAAQALAGTIAHELGHVFGAEHIAAGATQPYPLMAIESTGLPTVARLAPRRFSETSPVGRPNAATVRSGGGAVLRGDFNLDGSVDGLDFAALQASWGQTDRLASEGDANGDHLVDGADLAWLISNWSDIGGPSGPLDETSPILGDGLKQTSVPEPSAVVLLVGLLPAALWRLALRRRKRRGMGSICRRRAMRRGFSRWDCLR